MITNPGGPKRGAFILLEGVDRCGKTTQVSLLTRHLLNLSLATVAYRFPDRTTQGEMIALEISFMSSNIANSTHIYSSSHSTLLAVGGLINGYLQSSAEVGGVDDRAIHLLFSANRWEAAPKLVDTLAQGTHIICDRYAYSGVAFTSAKREEDRSTMSGGELTLDWCICPDVGLPAPDAVIFLDLDLDEAEKRGG